MFYCTAAQCTYTVACTAVMRQFVDMFAKLITGRGGGSHTCHLREEIRLFTTGMWDRGEGGGAGGSSLLQQSPVPVPFIVLTQSAAAKADHEDTSSCS